MRWGARTVVGAVFVAGFVLVVFTDLPKRNERADGLPQALIDDFPRR